MAGEKAFWDWLSGSRKHFRERLHINRVENAAGAGMPDVEGFLGPAEVFAVDPGAQFWLELKQETRPARPTTPIRFDLRKREKQIEWLRRRYELGAHCYWLLRVVGDDPPGRMVYLLPGDMGHILKAGILESELAVACLDDGKIFDSATKPHIIIEKAITCRNKPFPSRR